MSKGPRQEFDHGIGQEFDHGIGKESTQASSSRENRARSVYCLKYHKVIPKFLAFLCDSSVC